MGTDKVRPIDMSIIDKKGITWVWFAPIGCDIPPQWTMVEPIDKARWDAIMADMTPTGDAEPPEFFKKVRKSG